MILIKNGEQIPAYRSLVLPQTSELMPEVPHRGSPIPLTQAHANSNKPSSDQIAENDNQELNVTEAEPDPDCILEEARREAELIIAEARSQAGEIERTAREKAVQEARASASAELAAALEPLRTQLARTIEEVSEVREQIASYAERELVQLAIEIARKIVRREVRVDRDIVISLARVALARMHNRALAIVHLHPDDYQYVHSHRDRLGTANTVKLIEDASVSRGGCLIETDLGDVDARLEHQFSEIERGFFHDLE